VTDACAIMRAMRRSLAAVAAAIVLASASALAAGASAYPQTWVSYPTLLAQVRSGPLIRAIINPQRKDVEIKFTNLDEWHAYYPAGAQPELQRLLHARHVRIIFVRRSRASPATTASRPVHHKLRYIAGGILAAVVVLGGSFLLWRRRLVARSSPR
jgi:hypothetical protein